MKFFFGELEIRIELEANAKIPSFQAVAKQQG
jgi:hypothetical protein